MAERAQQRRHRQHRRGGAQHHAQQRAGARARLPIKDFSEKYGLRSRFLRDERIVTGLLCNLLSVTPVFAEAIFETEKAFSRLPR